MGKRKRSLTEDAAIFLLTEDLDTIDEAILVPLSRKLRTLINGRQPSRSTTPPGSETSSQNPSSVTRRQPSKSTTLASRETSPQNGNSVIPPRLASEPPSGPLGKFLYQLLLKRTEIDEFFSAGTAKVLAQVFERSDGRIEILRKFSRWGELTLSDKFQRLLADRSLTLSHEQYLKGTASVAAYAGTLKLTKNEDKKLAIDAIYRGRTYRKLEQDVKESGISAVACCEHTLFKKGVRVDQIGEVAGYLKLPTFAPILQLAKTLSNLLEESQLTFDALVGRDTKLTGPCSTSANLVDGEVNSNLGPLQPSWTDGIVEQQNAALQTTPLPLQLIGTLQQLPAGVSPSLGGTRPSPTSQHSYGFPPPTRPTIEDYRSPSVQLDGGVSGPIGAAGGSRTGSETFRTASNQASPSMSCDNAGNEGQAALENAPTQLTYYEIGNHDLGFGDWSHLWQFGPE